jgi:carbamoyl-phosphate synthase large subunit
VQFVLDPTSDRYYVIEVNARLSRSSALASKACGYPLAWVAAKIALHRPLPDILNNITGSTTSIYEPSLDYVVVKMPRWEQQKFHGKEMAIGPAMQSVGEVMAIGRRYVCMSNLIPYIYICIRLMGCNWAYSLSHSAGSFEEALNKATRMVMGVEGLTQVAEDLFPLSFDVDKANQLPATCPEKLLQMLQLPSTIRLSLLALTLQRKCLTVDECHSITHIDRFFIHKIKAVVDFERVMQRHVLKTKTPVSANTLRRAKQLGISDKRIAQLCSMPTFTCNAEDVRLLRKCHGILPVVKQIDTVAGEYPCSTSFCFMTYNADTADPGFALADAVVVLGSGTYRIGSSCEFDFCAVSCLRSLARQGMNSVMINHNPETVSTDFDECDTLFLEELSVERVRDIYDVLVQPRGVIVSVGGQTPQNIVTALHAHNVIILGTSPKSIDLCENREKFGQLLDSLQIDQPEWAKLSFATDADLLAAERFAEKVGFPVLVRPSYVLSGAAMRKIYSSMQLRAYLAECRAGGSLLGSSTGAVSSVVVISKFLEHAKEIEIDAVAQNGRILNFAIAEHVQNAGVHSGDASFILPAQFIWLETLRRIKKVTGKVARALCISGCFNVQFIAIENDVKIIECNLRASRSIPYVSKTLGVDFIALATRAMTSEAYVKEVKIDINELHTCVKQVWGVVWCSGVL